MGEEKNHVGDLPLADEYPEPCVDDELKGEEKRDISAIPEDITGDKAEKCSPNLLEMLKAAESRRSSQDRDKDRPEANKAGTKENIAEALKTNMVSRGRPAKTTELIIVQRMQVTPLRT